MFSCRGARQVGEEAAGSRAAPSTGNGMEKHPYGTQGREEKPQTGQELSWARHRITESGKTPEAHPQPPADTGVCVEER